MIGRARLAPMKIPMIKKTRAIITSVENSTSIIVVLLSEQNHLASVWLLPQSASEWVSFHHDYRKYGSF